MVSFPLGFFFLRLFSLSLVFYSLNLVCFGILEKALVFISFGVLWPSWVCGLASVIHLGKFLAIVVSNVSYAPFSFSSGVPFAHMVQLWNCSTVFGYSISGLLFFLFFPPWISVWEVFLELSSSSPVPWLSCIGRWAHGNSLNFSHSIIPCIGLFILRVSNSLLPLLICFCMLSAFSPVHISRVIIVL